MSDSSIRRERRERRKTALTLGAALAAVPVIPAAQAATFNVSNLDDSGPGSLRQAIEDANAAAGADVIQFQAGLTGTITLTSGELAVYDSVDVQGPGAAVLAVSGGVTSRVFYLYNGSALLDVTISGLTISGGNATLGGGIVDWGENLVLDSVAITENTAFVGNEGGGDGGGIWATDLDGDGMTLTIRDSTISGNGAGSDGGGIYLYQTGGPVLIDNSVISGNQAADGGGGIYLYNVNGDVTIVDSTISRNFALSGGGIYLYDTDGGTVLIERSTISDNLADDGAGLLLWSPDDPFIIRNSTISRNLGFSDGSGIFLYNSSELEIRHTTIAGNDASGTGGGVLTLGGPVLIENSIVGNNSATNGPDLSTSGDGSFDVAYSLVELPGAANISDNGGNVFNQDPQLGALANNGGPTLTHLPAATSPAIDAGDPAFVPPPATDQRGLARVVDGRIDMGAVEAPAPAVPGTIQLTFSAASVAENAGTVTITATRTGGSDGAISVTVNTANGTAVAPGDYGAVIGSILSWADGDTAPKTLNVTIVDDTDDEPDEAFDVILSNPTGGATLGSPANAILTILDDDAPAQVVEIPTVGDAGMALLTALMGMAGLYLLRRQ